MSARIILPGYPHHVVQRGHNRQAVFTHRSDYDRYLATLLEFKLRYNLRLYAYCLMPNHVHLLLAPETPAGLGQLMKRLAGRHTRGLNRRHKRTGSLWDGRYRSSVVDREDYLLACTRYIDLNPVKAGIVTDPVEYPWSSCRHHLGHEAAPLLDANPCMLDMGDTEESRQLAYRSFLDSGIPDQQRQLISEAVRRGQPTGDQRFDANIAKIIGRPVRRRGRGRPPKNK